MIIEVIDDLETFARLKGNWEAVYDADPEAQFFLSWDWLFSWVGQLSTPWFILAAKQQPEASQYVAFFPLKLKTKQKSNSVSFYNEISMAGAPAADYTGFICSTEHEQAAIEAFARQLKTMHWTNLHLEYFCASDPRFDRFLQAFPEKQFNTRPVNRINKADNIDLCACPGIGLPGDWEMYLNERLSAETRRKARRFLRQLDNSDELRITHSGPDTIERDLKKLLEYWAIQWGERKGSRLQAIQKSNYRMLLNCAQRGFLFVPVLWKGDAPLGALATFVDRRKRSMLVYMSARDLTFNNPSPGFLLNAHSIRFAIENGYTTYDFLHGNEPYKYSLGAIDRRIQCLILSTTNNKNLGNRLDPRGIEPVFKLATELHKSRKLAEAEHAYRQVLATSPNHALALFCFAQVLEQKGDYSAATKAFRSLAKVQPGSKKAQVGIARNLALQGKLLHAAAAYRQFVEQSPDFAPARHGLAVVLCKMNQLEEALDELRSALNLEPKSSKAQSLWCSAIAAAAKRFPYKQSTFATVSSSLADAMQAAGQRAFAVRCYRQALELQPELTAAHMGLQQLLIAERSASVLAIPAVSSTVN